MKQRKNQHPVTKLAVGESYIVRDKKPGELSQEHKNARYHNMRIKGERVPEGTRVVRVA